MKTTAVAILALVSASALAQPIAILKDNGLNTRDIGPTDATRPHLETRKLHGLRGLGNILKSIFSRNEDGDRSVVARDLFGDNGELLARNFHADEFLEARDFEDNYLDARDFDDMLEARDFEDNYLEARDFEDYLEARNFDDDYLEMRDLEARTIQEMPRVAGPVAN